MPYEAGTKLEGHLKAIGMIGMVVFAAGLFLFGPKPEPAPLNHLAYGCFVSENAPSILLEDEGMSIGQENFPLIGFHLQRQKTGIALTAERPISAYPSDAGYTYSIDKIGVGRFISFYKVIGEKAYGVFDEAELSGFRMLAVDGRYIAYQKANLERCG